MDDLFSLIDLERLQKLLAPQLNEEDSESDDDLPESSTKAFGPGDIKEPKVTEEVNAGPQSILKGEGKEICHPEEVKNQVSEDQDSREVPEYEMKFKQSVGAENVFFGIGFKTPSTASCEWLSIFIELPSEIREEVDLSVESDAIDLQSPKYRLHLPTPHPVDPNLSTAKWHTDTSTLEISLRLVRELDGINF